MKTVSVETIKAIFQRQKSACDARMDDLRRGSCERLGKDPDTFDGDWTDGMKDDWWPEYDELTGQEELLLELYKQIVGDDFQLFREHFPNRIV